MRGEAPSRAITDLIDYRYAEVKGKLSDPCCLERELAGQRARAATLHPRDCHPSGIWHVKPVTWSLECIRLLPRSAAIDGARICHRLLGESRAPVRMGRDDESPT